MEKTIENATFHINTTQEDYGDEENLGGGVWEFSYREIKRILKRLPALAEDSFTSEIPGQLEEVEESVEPYELATAGIQVYDADTAISLACAMIHLGGIWNLSYSGQSEYWFWHDLYHAENDYCVNEDGTITPGAHESAEIPASLESARNALNAGVSRGEIARQLVQIELAWEGRWGAGRTVQLLEDFLDGNV